MHEEINEVLISEDILKKRIAVLGAQITADYKNAKSLLIIGVLKGSFIFLADLVRTIKLDCEIDFISVSSYQDASISSGAVKILKDVSVSVNKKNILFVEDIIDTGFTMSKVMEMFMERGANSVKLCSLLNKQARRKVDVKIDYKGFDIPDEFVVGYGLDFSEKHRNLPYIGILDPKIYH